ncbi:MAG: SRPBCC family protein [Dehalococcoidia bacterium]
MRNRHGTATVTLPSDREILITRQFDAPAGLVFKAYTTPELVKRWWGFETSEWLVCEIDLREGGGWRYVTREEDGTEVGFHGEYRTIEAPHRLVSTEVFEGMPDAAALDTIVFEERDSVTTLRMTVLHDSQEHRDAHIASGMEGGMQVSMDRLEDIVVEQSRAG